MFVITNNYNFITLDICENANYIAEKIISINKFVSLNFHPPDNETVCGIENSLHKIEQGMLHDILYTYTHTLRKYFKNTVNLFIHIARIPIGDSPRVHPNILKCPLHSPVAKGYRLVVIASRTMVCKTPTYYLILESLAYARGCVILRSHILILLLLILLIFHHIHS